MKTKLEFYHTIIAIVGKHNVAIGGSMSLLAHKDPSVSPDYVPGDIDLCIGSEYHLMLIDQHLKSLGYTMTLDIPTPFGFTVRRQYKLGVEKHDFFINPDLGNLISDIDDITYINTSVVWCARGFYAGLGSDKAWNQLVNSGLIGPHKRFKMSFRQKIKKYIVELKYLFTL
jgi:hypothetical protein